MGRMWMIVLPMRWAVIIPLWLFSCGCFMVPAPVALHFLALGVGDTGGDFAGAQQNAGTGDPLAACPAVDAFGDGLAG